MPTKNLSEQERTATDQHSGIPARAGRGQRNLTRFQLDVLATIAGYTVGRYQNSQYDAVHPHGLAIKQTLTSRYGTEVNHGRLYPNLDELVERGLVEKNEHDKRTNEYALTDDGWTVLRQRCQFIQKAIDEYDATTGGTGGGRA